MTSEFRNYINKNSAARRSVENNRYESGTYAYLEEAKRRNIRRKPASDETLAHNAEMLRWERRSNRCEVCFEAKAANGSCSCE